MLTRCNTYSSVDTLGKVYIFIKEIEFSLKDKV